MSTSESKANAHCLFHSPSPLRREGGVPTSLHRQLVLTRRSHGSRGGQEAQQGLPPQHSPVFLRKPKGLNAAGLRPHQSHAAARGASEVRWAGHRGTRAVPLHAPASPQPALHRWCPFSAASGARDTPESPPPLPPPSPRGHAALASRSLCRPSPEPFYGGSPGGQALSPPSPTPLTTTMATRPPPPSRALHERNQNGGTRSKGRGLGSAEPAGGSRG